VSFDVNSYKADARSKDELVSDMTKGLRNEVVAIRHFEKLLEASSVESPSIVYCGSEKEGEVLMEGDQVANVGLFPDYLLKFRRHRRAQFKFIEVKICNPHSRLAYFKVKQLEQYRDMGSVLILFVMGFDTCDPKYMLVEPEEILKIDIDTELVYGKETMKIPTNFFRWDDFRQFNRKANPLEKSYIKEHVPRKV